MAYTTTADIYQKTGLSSTDIDLSLFPNIITDSEAEIELLTGRKFSSGNTKTEYLNGPAKDVTGAYGAKAMSISGSDYPLQSITAFQILNDDGSVQTDMGTITSVQITAGTFRNSYYIIETMDDPLTNLVVPYGKFTLINDVFPTGVANIKISYTYGYTTVPAVVQTATTCLASMRTWVTFLGGKYSAITQYSIPQQNVTKGDLYARGLQQIETLKAEAERLLERIGYRARRLFFSTGNYR